MLWVLLSILAAFSWSVVNIIDKFVVTKWVRKPIVLVMILGVIGLLASLIVYLVHGFNPLSYQNIFLAFIAGLFNIVSALFYLKAIKIEEVSRVVPLFYLSPLFVLILAAIFLAETFTPLKYFGIFLLVIGAILISSRNPAKLSFGKAFYFMIFYSLIMSMNVVIMKYLLGFADFWTIFSYMRLGFVFALIPMFYFNFSDLMLTLKQYGKKSIAIMSLSSSLGLVGQILITAAASLGAVTLVMALSSVQPFFVLLFTIPLSIFFPKVLKEEISGPIILLKSFAIILMFIGVILITYLNP